MGEEVVYSWDLQLWKHKSLQTTGVLGTEPEVLFLSSEEAPSTASAG